jgi:peptide/nickel transport system substrate-binding protein
MVTALAVLFGATASLFAQAGSEKDPLVVIQSAEPTGLDPVNNRTVPAYNVTLHNLRFPSAEDSRRTDGTGPGRELCERKRYLLAVQTQVGVTFHNGEALTADAVKYTIDEIFNPRINPPGPTISIGSTR